MSDAEEFSEDVVVIDGKYDDFGDPITIHKKSIEEALNVWPVMTPEELPLSEWITEDNREEIWALLADPRICGGIPNWPPKREEEEIG